MKNTLVFQGPIGSISGYGAHARDIVHSIIDIIDDSKWEVVIVPTLWGATTDNALDKQNPKDNEIIKRLISKPLPRKPDIFFQLALPNEVHQHGTFNILCTAGIESTMASPEWLEGGNKADLIIFPSTHAENVMKKSVWEKKDTNNNASLGKVELLTNTAILFEGIDTDIYCVKESSGIIKTVLDEIPNDFCFLMVGHWLPGIIGQDRKNIGATISAFIEAFHDHDNPPALVLKTALINGSVVDNYETERKLKDTITHIKNNLKIDSTPPIYLLHGECSDHDMNSLYNHNKIKCMVSTTRGEGYGRPLAEFSAIGKPIIASKWSGHLDFLHKDFVTLIDGQLDPIHPSAQISNILIKEAHWFSVNIEHVTEKMLAIYNEYPRYLVKAEKQQKYIRNYDLKSMKLKLKEILDPWFNKVPAFTEFVLPSLKKI